MDALANEVRNDLFSAVARRDGDPRLFAFLARAADRMPMRLAFRALPLGYVLMRRLVRPGLALLRRAIPG
jgi:predicted nuclease with RNAse H fold